jgi:tRNA(Ser,Leu) C12 N-acetylase TAN1
MNYGETYRAIESIVYKHIAIQNEREKDRLEMQQACRKIAKEKEEKQKKLQYRIIVNGKSVTNPDFKKLIADEVMVRQRTIASVAAEYRLNWNTVKQWCVEHGYYFRNNYHKNKNKNT